MSALKSILIHIDTSPRIVARLKATLALAEQHDAQVTAVYVVAPTFSQYPFAMSAGVAAEDVMRKFETDRREQTRALFERTLGANTKRVTWIESNGEPVYVVSRQALCTDLLVLGQREPNNDAHADLPFDFVESALLASGKPGLLIPYIGVESTVGRVILVAWKESREAARAVVASLPMLQLAEKVHVATWGHDNSVDGTARLDIETYLRRHGVAPEVRRYPSVAKDFGEHLMSMATDMGVDLLVMGCYGHSRAREWALGGASRAVLKTMTVPVLMAH